MCKSTNHHETATGMSTFLDLFFLEVFCRAFPPSRSTSQFGEDYKDNGRWNMRSFLSSSAQFSARTEQKLIVLCTALKTFVKMKTKKATGLECVLFLTITRSLVLKIYIDIIRVRIYFVFCYSGAPLREKYEQNTNSNEI